MEPAARGAASTGECRAARMAAQASPRTRKHLKLDGKRRAHRAAVRWRGMRTSATRGRRVAQAREHRIQRASLSEAAARGGRGHVGTCTSIRILLRQEDGSSI